MRANLHALVSRRGRCEAGFTMVELMIAIFVMAGGILALVGTLDVSRQLAGLSEKKEAAVHVGEREMERILARDYPSVGLTTLPQHASDPADPRFYVTDGVGANPSSYQWSQRPGGAGPDPLVYSVTEPDNTSRAVGPGPDPWSDPQSGTSGKVYRFVTWVDDDKCGQTPVTSCPGTKDYKRVTIALTVDGSGGPKKPILISSIVTDPRASPLGNPLNSPYTTCLDPLGAPVECIGSVGTGVAKTWFLYDTPASSDTRQDIAGSHPTHATVAFPGTCTELVATGCPTPDLMGEVPPPAPDPLPALYNYSSEQPGTYAGGRVLLRDTDCAGVPSLTDNAKGELWTTAPLSSATTLTGDGALNLYTQTMNGATAHAQLCLAFYDVPSITNLVATPAVEIGRANYDPTTWPTTPTPIAFLFDFRSTLGNVTLPADHRIGVRAWVAASSAADIALIYDHPSYASSLQLNTSGG